MRIAFIGFGLLMSACGQNSGAVDPGDVRVSPDAKAIATSQTVAESLNWYEGGRLARTRADDWIIASDRDKLATAADFVAVALGSDHIRASGGMDTIKPLAVQMVDCIEEKAWQSYSGASEGQIKTAYSGAVCAIELGISDG